MTKILALSGKKQSGKNSAFNFLLGLEMLKSALVRGNMTVTNKGKLWVSDLWGDEQFQGIFDIDRQNEQMDRMRVELIYPFIRPYSFADILKQDVCIGVLGLSHEQCYGTDEDKNTLTDLRWENMPGVVTDLDMNANDDIMAYPRAIYHKHGKMTAREVMQYVGTEIFRKMSGDVWAESTIRRIQADGSEFAIITDCRFPNEVAAVQRAGGKVVRLTRGPASSEDLHESEVALDQDRYDWNNFDYILDNADMSVSEQNLALHELLVGWGWIDKFQDKTPETQTTG